MGIIIFTERVQMEPQDAPKFGTSWF